IGDVARGYWPRNPYMNPAPGAPVHPYQGSPHMYPMPSPGMYPIPSPGGFTLHPHPSPGGFFYAGAMAEPKGYFDSVMAMSSMATSGSSGDASGGYFGFGSVEGEILRDKRAENVEERSDKTESQPVEIDDVFFSSTIVGAGPSRAHSVSVGDKRPCLPRGPDSDPARAGQSPDEV
ncbi:hypothetical protein BDZ89DRAFT_1063790, partial [Hymenopellis radicata]